MSRLSDLIRQAKSIDNQLGADLEQEFRALTKRRSFGLVFERHQPEAVELAGRPVRLQDKVHVVRKGVYRQRGPPGDPGFVSGGRPVVQRRLGAHLRRPPGRRRR